MRCRDAAAIAGFLAGALSLTFALGELVTRAVASRSLIYNIEMVRYARLLKTADPLHEISHVHRPNAKATLMGVEIALDSLGHRSPELSEPRSAGRRRVLVLGSSTTMGWGVPQDAVFTSLVEQRLNAARPFGPKVSFEIANAGVGNYDSCSQLKLLQRQIARADPDILVLHYFIADAERRPERRDSFILEHSYFADYLFSSWSALKFLYGKEGTLLQHYQGLYAEGSEDWRGTLSCVAQMRELARSRGIPFIVMIVPDSHDLSPASPYRPLYWKMEEAFTRLGAPTINSFDAFSARFAGKEDEAWVARDDPHPNARAHALMAELLYRYLIGSDPLRLERRQPRRFPR